MDSILKQRLVGALILLALGVVFWPIIFVPPADPGDDVRVPVPTPPARDSSPLPEPDDLGLGLPRGSVDMAQPGNSDVLLPEPSSDAEGGTRPSLPTRDELAPDPDLKERTAALESPAIDADGLPIAYSLQVATMSREPRAASLRDELVAAGYKAYIKRLRREQGLLYRVLVGPRFARDELLPIKAAVDARWGVDSLIMRYLP